MLKYFFGIGIISSIVVATIIYGFSQIGLPWEIRKIELDNQRVSHLQAIRSAVESYYSLYLSLPQSLEALKKDGYVTDANIKDPKTGEYYTYKYKNVTGAVDYDLCANFSLDSKKVKNTKKDTYALIPDSVFDHPKGPYCFNLKVSAVSQQKRETYDKRYDLRVVYSTDVPGRQQKIAQTFKVDKDKQVKIVEFKMIPDHDAASALVTIREFADPNNPEAGAVLGTSKFFVNVPAIQTYKASFEPPLQFSKDKEYVIVYELDDIKSPAYDIIGYEDATEKDGKAYMFTWTSYEKRNDPWAWRVVEGVRTDYLPRWIGEGF